MEYKSCNLLEHGISFRHDNITNCTIYYSDDDENILFPKPFYDKDFSLDDLFAQKIKFKENAQKNIYLPGCKNCPCLETREWGDDFHINYIIISHWTKCNCGCIYCYFDSEKPYFQSLKPKSIMPLLKEIAKRDLFESNTILTIIGGEIGELPEFDELMRFAFKENFAKIIVHSFCIKYKKTVEAGLKKDKLEFIMSLDSGNKELYRKIKRVNKFDTVINNLKKYIKAQNKKKDQVWIKYIIIPGINDTKEQIYEWIMLCDSLGVKHIVLDLETSFYFKHKNNIPPKILELITYTEDQAEKLGMIITYYAHMMQIKHDNLMNQNK